MGSIDDRSSTDSDSSLFWKITRGTLLYLTSSLLDPCLPFIVPVVFCEDLLTLFYYLSAFE